MTASDTSMGELYVRAMESAGRYVNRVRLEQWHNATPCSEWDMRDLVGHITGENFWAAELFQGKTMGEVGGRLDGDLLGDDPVGAYNRSMEVASQAALEPGAMGRTTHLSFGDCPGSEYAKQLFLDLLVHGWDVAKGSGQDAQLDPVLVEAALPIAEEMAAMAESMGVGVFGSPQALPEEANPQARLLGILGRRDD